MRGSSLRLDPFFFLLVIIGSVGAAVGPVASGVVFDYGGSYVPIFVLFLLLTLAGILCSIVIRPKIASRTDLSASQVEIR